MFARTLQSKSSNGHYARKIAVVRDAENYILISIPFPSRYAIHTLCSSGKIYNANVLCDVYESSLLFSIVGLLATGICTAQVPNLVGNWTGSENAYAAEDGSYKLLDYMSISLAIVEQRDRLFKGYVTYTRNGTKIVEDFAGAIGSDNNTFYVAEFKDGYALGTIISNDEIEDIYLADGAMGGVAIDTLHRIK